MKLNPLNAALLGAGIAVVGTAGAIDLPHLFKHDQPAAVVAQAAPSQAGERVVPAAPMSTPPGQVPNYGAIVQQSASSWNWNPSESSIRACHTFQTSPISERPSSRRVISRPRTRSG